FSQGDQRDGFSLTAMGYDGRWSSTDHVPERAVRSSLIDRFGTLGPTPGGRSHRYSPSGELRTSSAAGLTLDRAYAIEFVLDGFSNFTYFLDDPVPGDQFEQKDERRVVGAKASQRFLGHFLGRDVESVAGVEGRFDHIPTLGLYHTESRQRLETVR